jgi:hypothetical protein
MIQILPGVKLDDLQRRVIEKITPYTDADGIMLSVTRGHSTPLEQLAMIERKARENGCLFTEFIPEDLHTMVTVYRDSRELKAYAWAQTLSALLMKGIVINPPLTFTCLEHYIRPTSEDMYLKLMHPSPHIKALDDPEPCPIDFSARVDRLLPTERESISLVVSIMQEAKRGGAGIRFIKPEPKNVCVHIDIDKGA